MLYMAVYERVSEGPVQKRVPGKVQHAVGHLIDPFGPARRWKHGQTDVLHKDTQWGPTHILRPIWCQQDCSLQTYTDTYSFIVHVQSEFNTEKSWSKMNPWLSVWWMMDVFWATCETSLARQGSAHSNQTDTRDNTLKGTVHATAKILHYRFTLIWL